MEYLIYSITSLLGILLIGFPSFLIYRLKKLYSEHIFTFYLVLGMIISSILILIIAWWGYFSCKILLSHYGYNFELMMNDTERIKNVSSENLDRVKILNTKRMGIGWPARAIFFEIIYFPYLLIVYVLTFFYSKMKINKKLRTN